LQDYCSRFGKEQAEEQADSCKPFYWQAQQHCSPTQIKTEQSHQSGNLQVMADLIKDIAKKKQSEVDGWSQDDDGESIRVCHHCSLPLGDVVHTRNDKMVHAECMAQLMLQDLQKDEAARLREVRAKKSKQHADYGIGWKMDHIPRNSESASKLLMRDVPQGMVCLVKDEAANSIRIASTQEPAAALNLEYLSTVLQVRRSEGCEPVFSLDPTTPDVSNSMQRKVFVPEWLAGTSVGEVLFQADYHLKELSMGEYEQPVVGMKSCFDHSEMQDAFDWNAREWFLVRKAEVGLSHSNMLVPTVKMGVEAREQVVNRSSLQDKPVTNPDHPLVMYANDFTQNFELIAERKSVMYHLRELAKASVVAKYLVDSGAELEESWFHVAEDKEVPCSMEVPQLWNERVHSEVNIEDNAVVRNINSSGHGVYGGVQFGLDKFKLSSTMPRRAAVTGTIPSVSSALVSSDQRISTGLTRPPSQPTAKQVALNWIPPTTRMTPLAAGISAGKVMPHFGRPGQFNLAVSGMRPGAVAAPGLAQGVAPPALSTLVAAPSSLMQAGLPQLTGLAKFNMALSVARQTAGPPSTPSDLMAVASGVPSLITTGPSAPIRLGAALTAASVPLRTQQQITPLDVSGEKPRVRPPAAGIGVAGVIGVPRLESLSALSAGVGMAPEVQLVPPSGFAPRIPALSMAMSAVSPRLQGVDLRLDQFDLSEAKRVSLEAPAGSWGSDVKPLDECAEMSCAFFASIDGKAGSKLLKDDDHALLSSIFNPALTDRRSEGDLFIPPDARHSHVEKLRKLVKQEDAIREKRRELFFSEDFSMSNPGPCFPRSWTPAFEITRGRASTRAPDSQSQGVLHLRPEYRCQNMVLECLLKTSTPIFEQCTEEGLRFRIYRVGSLEVRTTQEAEGAETVGAVFSIRSKAVEPGCACIEGQEKINTVMECVEHAFDFTTNRLGLGCRYYLVLETEDGNKIVTERLEDGSLTWIENPEDLEDRNSLAKVTRCDTPDTSITVDELLAYRAKLMEGVPPSSKRYAQAVLVRIVGARRVHRTNAQDYVKKSTQDFAFWLPSRSNKDNTKATKTAKTSVREKALFHDGPAVFDLPNRASRPPFQVRTH
jgi:hypothetical protein